MTKKQRRCSNCGELGHYSRTCPQPAKPHVNRTIVVELSKKTKANLKLWCHVHGVSRAEAVRQMIDNCATRLARDLVASSDTEI